MSNDAPLERLARATGRKVPTLLAARERSRERTALRHNLLADLAGDDDASVVMLGSWGRCEVTSGSDDDLVLLVHGPARDNVRPDLATVAALLREGDAFSTPGREGVFGDTAFSGDLVDNIGLDRDTNTNLTRRLLLLLESRALTNPQLHASARQAILHGYLQDTIKDFRPPRFLLNDVVRYWRTIGVDFVGKVRDRGGQGWGLRNAKLRTSRKLLFASGLVTILRCHEWRTEEMLEFLEAQFEMTPVDRVADACLHYGALDHGAAAIVAYDQFLQLLDDGDVRAELDAITSGADAAGSTHFDSVARLGVSLDQALLGLLFGPALARWTRDFAIL